MCLLNETDREAEDLIGFYMVYINYEWTLPEMLVILGLRSYWNLQ